MANETIDRKLRYEPRAVTLDEEKDPKVFQLPNSLDDRSRSPRNSPNEFEQDRAIQGGKGSIDLAGNA